ncbi:MAG TPA: hypothetical protein VK960_09090 [Acidimicrobiia bacterium]|nr:hypothetical protein [Acidimicrobiia bacterium]
MAKAAYLRVYLPADRVEEPLVHVAEPDARGRVLTRGEYGVWDESVREDAFVLEEEGRRYVCPRYPRLRMLEGLLAFRHAYRGPTASMLVPEAAAARAARELDRIQERFPAARSHILTSPFFVPLRWFAAFDPADRLLIEDESGLTIRYRSRMRDALRRMRRSVRILEEAGFDDAIIEQVQDLVRWMEQFPPRSLVELDYAEVASLFSPAELAMDESAAEVAASLGALEDGDLDLAADHYTAVATRWAHAQSLVYAN